MRALLAVACVAGIACASSKAPKAGPPPPETSASTSATTSAVQWCIDPDHCKDGLKRCLETCYKYNHPDGPANDACDGNCRANHCDRIICPPR